MQASLLDRITADPEIFGGKPIIRGTVNFRGAHPQPIGARRTLMPFWLIIRNCRPKTSAPARLRARHCLKHSHRRGTGTASVRFVDRCAGRRLATASGKAHVRKSSGPTRRRGAAANCCARNPHLNTIDTDGAFVWAAHAGIIRMPDVPADRRIELMRQILSDYTEAEIGGAMITVTGSRIRFSRRPD
jgi:hypothetical protein